MEENKKIDKLNRKIVHDTKKIRNLYIRNNILVFTPIVILAGTVTALYLNSEDKLLIKEFYPASLYLSFIMGSIPSMYLRTKWTQNKINKYKTEIKDILDELHGFAIEEDKKRMIKKN